MKKLFVGLVITSFAALTVWAGEAVNYNVDGRAFEGYMEKVSPAAPLVLLVHDWDGLTDYEVKRAGMLAELGYSVFCVDLYGAGVRPTEMADRRKCMSMLTSDRPMMRQLLQGSLDAAKAQGLNTGNCVAMGYCFGGSAVLEFARSGTALKGFATFHGGLDLPEGQDYSKTKGRVLIMHGTADRNIGMDQFAALADDLEKAGVSHTMISYGGAPHAWTVFESGAYREQQDKLSWEHFIQYLADLM